MHEVCTRHRTTEAKLPGGWGGAGGGGTLRPVILWNMRKLEGRLMFQSYVSKIRGQKI